MRLPLPGLIWPLALLLGVAACETAQDTMPTTMPGQETSAQDPATFSQNMNQNLDSLDQQLNDHRQRAAEDGMVPAAMEERIQSIENEIQQLRQRLGQMSQDSAAFEQESREIEREYQRIEQKIQQLDREPTTQLQR